MIIENSFNQGDPEWHDARLDSIGGIDISKIITTKGKRSESREALLIEKASQIISRKSKPLYQTYEMQWGHDNEPVARRLFEFRKSIPLSECAMIFNDDKRNWHISPDGYNEEKKVGWEAKCPQLKEFIKTKKENRLPTKHILQVQTSLAVTSWDSWWFMSYFPGLSPFMVEVFRDEPLIRTIKIEVKMFHNDLAKLIEELKQ